MPAAREWVHPAGDHIERAARDSAAWQGDLANFETPRADDRLPWHPSPLVFLAACAVGFVIGWWVASMGPLL